MELKSAISLLLLLTVLSGCWGETVHQHEHIAKKSSIIPRERKDVQPKVPTIPMNGQKTDIEPRVPTFPRGLTDPLVPFPRHLDDLSGSYVKEPEDEGKIIGGTELRANQWPFLVLVKLNISGTVHDWCGGSIIDDTHVLSAAHCYEESGGTYSIVAGEHNVSANEGTEQTRKVARVFNHPNYTSRPCVNDVAVLRLDSPLQLNNQVTTVFFNNINTCPEFNATCSVSGWGRTIEGDRQSTSKVPMTVEVPIRSQSNCSAAYPNDNFSNKQICAGNNGHDACQGDSGGPLMCQCGGMNQLTGIVSYGNGCGQQAFPGVYTRVSSYLDWFVEVVNGVHDNRTRTYNYHHQDNVDV